MSHASSIPEVSREDFDNILDDFLEKYEVVGSKYRPALGGTGLSGVEKLAVLRAAVDDEVEGLGKEENTRRILEFERMERGVKAPKERRERVKDVGIDEEKWDVESILCMCFPNTRESKLTGSNVYEYREPPWSHQDKNSSRKEKTNGEGCKG